MSIDRRRFIKDAGVTVGAAGALWAAPSLGGFVSPAAAVSGSSAPVSLWKSSDGSPDPPLSSQCLTGATSGAGRGSAVFTRSENPAKICVDVTLSTGTDITGRNVYILQSSSSGTCLGGTTAVVGTWAASPSRGPQTFCASIVSGATNFVVALQTTGGLGNDVYTSDRVSLP